MSAQNISKRKLLRTISLTSLPILGWSNSFAVASPPRTVLLKLDDVVAVKGRGLSDSWKKVRDFLGEQKISASLGIIGESLENPTSIYIDEMRTIASNSQFEIWNHGYTNHFIPNTAAGETAANVGTSAEVQFYSINRTQDLVLSRLGITSRLFGPHNSGMDDNTYIALSKIPEIRAIWFYAPRLQSMTSAYIFKREANLEHPIFTPNLSGLRQDLAAQSFMQPYVALQGHPDMWNADRFQAFTDVIRWLSAQGCKFLCASEYLKSSHI